MSTIDHIIGECRTYSDRSHTHAHSYAQLILPLQGSLFIQTDLHDCELDEDHLFFLPPLCQHTFYAHDRNEFLVLDIPKFACPTTNSSQTLRMQLDERWRAIRHLLLCEIRQTHASLNELFYYVSRLLAVEEKPMSIQFIHANYWRSISLKQLAQLEGYNLTYYCQWFKTITGTTPQHYIQMLRLDRAKALLRETNLSILQIAQQVGYEHHASLTRLFKQMEQITPQAYRQQTRKSDKPIPYSG